MSTRELIALGTSSQSPTRERSHNAYMLQWDGHGFLFDPGEGAQRQLTYAGVTACSIHTICITHFHGDHCLGLPGILHRLSSDRCGRPIDIYYPESGQGYFDSLCHAAAFQSQVEIIGHPVETPPGAPVELNRTEHFVLKAQMLEHSMPTLGYRLEEPDGRQFLREKLALAGIEGQAVGELQRKGVITIGSQVIHLEDVTVHRPGSVFAFIMDTRPCSNAVALARDADLLVMEATYTSQHQKLADVYCHSTAADAARTALEAGARLLAITHFSQRYLDASQHIQEAKEIFANVIDLHDMDRIAIPRKHTAPVSVKNEKHG